VHDCDVSALKEPELDEILAFCAEDPVERVFLEDIASPHWRVTAVSPRFAMQGRTSCRRERVAAPSLSSQTTGARE